MNFAPLDVGEEAVMTPTHRATDRQLGSLKREERGWVVERPDATGVMMPMCTTDPGDDETRLVSYKRQKVVAYVVARRVRGVEDPTVKVPEVDGVPDAFPDDGVPDAFPDDGVPDAFPDDGVPDAFSDDGVPDAFPDDGVPDDGGCSSTPKTRLQNPPATSKSASSRAPSKSDAPRKRTASAARAKGVKVFVKGRGEVKRQHVADVLRLCLDNLPFGDMYQLVGGIGVTKTPRITYNGVVPLKNYGEFYKHVMETHDVDLVEKLHHHPEQLLDVQATDRTFFR